MWIIELYIKIQIINIYLFLKYIDRIIYFIWAITFNYNYHLLASIKS